MKAAWAPRNGRRAVVGLAISIVSLLPSHWSFQIAKERTAQRHGHACAGGGEHDEKKYSNKKTCRDSSQ